MSSRATPPIETRWEQPEAHSGEFPPDWEARRKAVYRRDDWTCQHCGTKSGPHAGDYGVPLHAHHIVPRADGGTHGLSNLETLCEDCHQESHDHDIFRDQKTPSSRWVPSSLLSSRLGYGVAGVAGVVLTGYLWFVGQFLAGVLDSGVTLSGGTEIALIGVAIVGITIVTLLRPGIILVVLGMIAGGISVLSALGEASYSTVVVASSWIPVILIGWGILTDKFN